MPRFRSWLVSEPPRAARGRGYDRRRAPRFPRYVSAVGNGISSAREVPLPPLGPPVAARSRTSIPSHALGSSSPRPPGSARASAAVVGAIHLGVPAPRGSTTCRPRRRPRRVRPSRARERGRPSSPGRAGRTAPWTAAASRSTRDPRAAGAVPVQEVARRRPIVHRDRVAAPPRAVDRAGPLAAGSVPRASGAAGRRGARRRRPGRRECEARRRARQGQRGGGRAGARSSMVPARDGGRVGIDGSGARWRRWRGLRPRPASPGARRAGACSASRSSGFAKK